MFNFLKATETSPQRKIFTAKNYEILDGLIKDEAETRGTTESVIIEETLLRHFLNEDDEHTSAVVRNLFEANGIASTCEDIFSRYAAIPHQADDSLLPLLDFLFHLELRHRTHIKGSEDYLDHFIKCLTRMLNEIKKYKDADSFYRFPLPDGTYGYIAQDDITIMEHLIAVKDDPENVNCATYFAFLIDIIRKYWYFGGDSETPAFRNWSATFSILHDVCVLARMSNESNTGGWPNYPQYRNELVKIIKSITVSDGRKGAYHTDQPILSRYIWLNGTCVKTTESARILKSDPDKATTEYTHARRIIHGPQAGITKKPHILLYTDEEALNLDALTQRLVQEQAAEEFPNPRDAYAVQIYDDGIYYDARIKWKTV